MTEPDQRDEASSPRVVRKVVKRTVTRPTAPSTGDAAGRSTPAAPRVGASTGPRTSALSRLRRADQKKAAALARGEAERQARTSTTTDPTSGAPRDAAAPASTAPQVGPRVGPRVADAWRRARDAARGVTDLAGRGVVAGRDRGADAYWAVRDYRLPEIAAVPATILTGVLAGLLVVGGGWVLGALFSALRGTSSGGALWGGLALIVVITLAAEGAARLLAAFGASGARASVALSLLAVAALVMAFFVDAVDGPWAWLVVPGLCAATLPLAHRLVLLAETTPAEG